MEEEEDVWSDLEPGKKIRVGSKGVDDGVPIGEVMNDPSPMRVVMGSFSKVSVMRVSSEICHGTARNQFIWQPLRL